MPRKNRKVTVEDGRISMANGLAALYREPIAAQRTGALYSAFPYPTKISPEAIALLIAAHTKVGDTVFDGFAGSGTTGIAALLCENPPAHLRKKAKQLGLNVTWGARNAVLYELGALGAYVTQTLTNPPEPKAFQKAAEELLASAEARHAWMYEARDPSGKSGSIRHIIWTDELRCPSCKKTVTLWDASVSLNPARIASTFLCPLCKHKTSLDAVERLTTRTHDGVLGRAQKLRSRKPVRIYGVTGRSKWSRPADGSDLTLLRKIAATPIPESVPRITVPWGDLYRSGYHEGITHLHHFYTRRNLIVFAGLWEQTGRYSRTLRDALRFWLLSYNASHATIMSRVVAKTGQKDVATTSAQPGVLYVSGLPVEKNLFFGLRRKLTTISLAFEATYGRTGKVVVKQRSSCKLDLPSGSIDYVFTDPPFGGNIPYAEVNFVNEAWLDSYTDRTEEIIVSKHQDKSVKDYEVLMTRAFKELHRVLAPAGKATVVFHSSSADVWNALQAAYKACSFGIERASVLDKTQPSFKQVTTEGAVRGDPMLLLEKKLSQIIQLPVSVAQVVERLEAKAAKAQDPKEQTAQRLYSRLITHFLARDQAVPLDAGAFYTWLANRRAAALSADAIA